MKSVCQKCGDMVGIVDCRATHFKTIEGNFTADDAIRRRHKCVRCKHSFTTYEMPKEIIYRIIKERAKSHECQCKTVKKYVYVLKQFMDDFDMDDFLENVK